MKAAIVRIVFFFLGRALKALYKLDSRVRREIDGWAEGFSLVIYGCEGGPRLSLVKRGGRLETLRGEPDDNGVVLTFKCIGAAFLLCTAQLGVAQANAQRRFALKGDIHACMSAVRCLVLVERYLFPAFIAKRLLLSLPPKEKMALRVYAAVLFGI